MKQKKNLEKRKLVKYSIFIIPVFLFSFYLSYRFDIGGQFISVVNQTVTTIPTITTTTVKPKVKIIATEIVNTTTIITTTKTLTTIFMAVEKTTTTSKSSGGGGGERATTTTVPKPVAKIIINEIMYNPPGSDDDNEWVEVYNNDTIDCDINDWSLSESGTNHRLTLQQGSMTIPAGTYAIITDNATNFLVNHPSFNETIIKCSFSLGNDGEYVALKDYSSNVVDGIIYNSTYGGDGNNRTLERKGNDWNESLVDGGTPGFVNSIFNLTTTTTSTTTTTETSTTSTTILTTTTATSTTTSSTTTSTIFTTTSTTTTTISTIADHVVISEFLVDSSGLESAYEFVELYNPINSSVNITGWNIAYKSASGVSWGKVADITGFIQAYGFFLIGGDSINSTPDIIETSLGFAKNGGHIVLRNATNYIIDKVGYGSAIDPESHACPSPGTDKSMERKPGYLNSTAGNGWDSDNNLEDFILRNETEPQNSTFVEIPY